MARTAQLKTEVLDILAKWSADPPQEGEASGLSRECQLWRAIGEAIIADNSASLQATPVNKVRPCLLHLWPFATSSSGLVGTHSLLTVAKIQQTSSLSCPCFSFRPVHHAVLPA